MPVPSSAPANAPQFSLENLAGQHRTINSRYSFCFRWKSACKFRLVGQCSKLVRWIRRCDVAAAAAWHLFFVISARRRVHLREGGLVLARGFAVRDGSDNRLFFYCYDIPAHSVRRHAQLLAMRPAGQQPRIRQEIDVSVVCFLSMPTLHAACRTHRYWRYVMLRGNCNRVLDVIETQQSVMVRAMPYSIFV